VLHDLVASLALDLNTIRSQRSSSSCSSYGALGTADLERGAAWQAPWTEEAALHYLNMQVCHFLFIFVNFFFYTAMRPEGIP
jgi:hypothetical protein